ncbi:MAG: PAS domain S-box protein, partial [Campylobacteraceae bacterium]|nr:PAS domain S-box protein [Campylobacteraceae bacterium]
KDSIRLAVADTLSDQACVSCHNALKNSPKKDWQLYDMRGALEIILPIDTLINNNKSITLQVSSMFFIVFAALLAWIINIILNLNKTNKKVKHMVHILDLHKAALDNHAIVSILDDKGNISYVNDKFCEISGYTKEELLGKDHTFLESSDELNQKNTNKWETIQKGDI